MAVELKELIVPDAAALRRWLESGPTDGVWLVLAKKGVTSPTSLSYDHALDEALCFGWIDGQSKGRDEHTYFIRFTPRRARSMWSKRNVGIISRLVEEGRMQPPGTAEVERAKADGRWEAAYSGQATIEMATDLAAALEEEPAASAMFGILTSQNRYAILHRLQSAKTPATRGRLIAQFVTMLGRGETPYPQRKKLPTSRA